MAKLNQSQISVIQKQAQKDIATRTIKNKNNGCGSDPGYLGFYLLVNSNKFMMPYFYLYFVHISLLYIFVFVFAINVGRRKLASA